MQQKSCGKSLVAKAAELMGCVSNKCPTERRHPLVIHPSLGVFMLGSMVALPCFPEDETLS